MRLPSFLARLLRVRSLLLGLLLLFLCAGVLLLLAAVFRFQVVIDVTTVLVALAAVLVAWALLHLARHVVRPRRTVSVGYDVRLEQPMLPVVGRYTFRLEVFYEVEEKREHRRVDQGAIELRFRKGDHPDLLEWCCLQISEHLERHRAFASSRFPNARVLLPEHPSRARLRAELAEDGAPPAVLQAGS